MKAMLCSLALLALGLSAAFAQAPSDGDLLRQARRERELATQKAEADLRTAINKTKTQTSGEALAALKQLLADIEANANLDPSRKGDMVKELQSRLRTTEAITRARGEKPDVPTAGEQRRAKDEARRVELEKQEAERLKVAAAVAEIDRLLGQGRTQEADRKAQQLAQDYPTHPAAKVMAQRTSIRNNIRDAKDLLAQQADSHNAAMKDINKPLPKDDMAYDKGVWDRNRNSKYRGNGKPLTEKEQAILKGLSKTIRPDWQGAKFDSVIEALQGALGTAIVIDPKAREELNISSEATVDLSLPREISTRTALRKVLLDKGLGYVIKDEMVYVTTVARTRDMLTTRAYYVGDLVTPNELTTLPGQARLQEDAVVKQIIDSIKRSVDPMSWESDASGGKATISYDPLTRALIVRQTAEVHMLLRNSMR